MSGDDELRPLACFAQPFDEQFKGLRMEPCIDFFDTGKCRRVWVIEKREQSQKAYRPIRRIRQLRWSPQASFVEYNDNFATRSG